jgi:hypothetical protein
VIFCPYLNFSSPDLACATYLRSFLDFFISDQLLQWSLVGTTDTKINQAMAAEIRAERGAADLTIEQLSDASGVPLSTLKRILKGTIDVNVADLGAIARAFSDATGKPVSPQEIVQRAVKRAGGYEVLGKDS